MPQKLNIMQSTFSLYGCRLHAEGFAVGLILCTYAIYKIHLFIGEKLEGYTVLDARILMRHDC